MPNLSIYLPERVVAEIDELRGSEGRGPWIRRALEQALGGKPGGQVASSGPGRSPVSKPIEEGSTPSSPAPASRKPGRGPEGRGAAPAAEPAEYELPKIARRKP